MYKPTKIYFVEFNGNYRSRNCLVFSQRGTRRFKADTKLS